MRRHGVLFSMLLVACSSESTGADPSPSLDAGDDTEDAGNPADAGTMGGPIRGDGGPGRMPDPCANDLRDGEETDVDCGGTCAPCGEDEACAVADDCQSGVCLNRSCAKPSCADGVKNGGEADVDCGYACVQKCAAGSMCLENADCVTATCRDGTCVTLAPKGVVTTDLTYSAKDSPIVLTGELQVGGTLTLEPGVKVLGGGSTLSIFGKLDVRGKAGAPVTLNNVQISGRGANDSPSRIEIRHAHIQGGALLSVSSPGIGSTSLLLEDSLLEGLKERIYLWYPAAECLFARNVFKGMSISVGTSDTPVTFESNLFTGNPGNAADMRFAIELWADYKDPSVVVRYNSFLDSTSVALRLTYDALPPLAVENYWNGADALGIQAMVHDKSDDLALAGTITTLPALAAPHTATPSEQSWRAAHGL